jgi:hypothetical protein
MQIFVGQELSVEIQISVCWVSFFWASVGVDQKLCMISLTLCTVDF